MDPATQLFLLVSLHSSVIRKGEAASRIDESSSLGTDPSLTNPLSETLNSQYHQQVKS